METGKKAVIGSRKTKDVRTVTVDTEFRASDTHKATPAPTAGKKRKKKKKAETNDVQCATACQASEFSDHHKNSIVSERQSKDGSHCSSGLSNSSNLSRMTACTLLPSTSTTPAGGSSSSSFESSKPPYKITRYTSHSSSEHEKMSIGGSESHLMNQKGPEQDLPTSTATTYKEVCTSQTVSNPSNNGPSTVSSTQESLRWENQCSDEEKEKERIEVYRNNRRKRYTNQFRYLEHVPQPNPYYTPSESLSS